MSSSEQATAHAIPAEAGTVPVSAGVDIDDNEGGIGLREWQTERGARRVRPLWLLAGVLCVIPLLPVLTLVALQLTYHSPPPNTGDPLLDAVVSELQDDGGNLAVSESSSNGWWVSPVAKYHSMEAALQPFDEDPRSWQARYALNLLVPIHALSEIEGRQCDRRVWFLEEAQRRGAVDTAMLSVLGPEHRAEWTSQAWRQYQFDPEDTAISYKEVRKRIGREVRRMHAQDMAANYADRLRLAPKDALPCYQAASAALANGDERLAWELIREGNERPECTRLDVFPLDSFYATACKGQYVCNRLVTAQLWASFQHAHSFSLPKTMLRDLAKGAAARRDGVALNTLQIACIRMCRNQPNAAMGAGSEVQDCRVIREAVEASWPQQLSQHQQELLTELRSLENEQANRLGNLSGGGYGSGIWRATYRFPGWQEGLDVMGSSPLHDQCDRLDDAIAMIRQCGPLNASVSKGWDKLAAFDYQRLEAAGADPSEPASGH